MDLFSFAKDIGKKLFGDSDADAAEKIKAHILEDNPGVSNLTVSYADGCATLAGDCESQAAREKAVLLAGNVENVEKVEGDDLTVPAEAAVEEVAYYEIQKGDTLWKVASEFYGNGAKYTAIFDANREVIKDPDLIYPGQKIRIPQQG